MKAVYDNNIIYLYKVPIVISLYFFVLNDSQLSLNVFIQQLRFVIIMVFINI